MNKILLLLFAFSIQAFAQNITIGSGTTITGGSAIFTINGNWNNSGTFTPGSSTVILNGASGTQTITNSAGETFYNLTINKAADDAQLVNNTTINGTLTCTSGDLDLNGNVLTLAGTLSETSGNTVKGSTGYITCSSDLNAPSSTNPHGIGIEITSAANLGTTTIIRGHEPQSGSGNTGMARYFEITPTNNSSLDAAVVYKYDDSELNSITESTFEMFISEDNGSNWYNNIGTLDADNNTYSVSNLSSLYRYTLASSSAPLPVVLVSFGAASTSSATGEQIVVLNWETATEVNNYGFEVQRRESSNEYRDTSATLSASWETIGFVEGSGNSNSPKSYEYIDNLGLSLDHSLSLNGLEYRLKQIDTDGQYTYYNQTAKVDIQITDINDDKLADVEIPTKFALKQNYPNPFNPTTVISYTIGTGQRSAVSKVQLKVYDMLGRDVATLVDREQAAGYFSINFDTSELPSGMYIYRIIAGSFVQTRKMLLMK